MLLMTATSGQQLDIQILEGKYSLESTDPRESEFAPTCVSNSLLSYLSITYLLICWFVYIANRKTCRFRAFLDSKIHTRLAIVTANELALV